VRLRVFAAVLAIVAGIASVIIASLLVRTALADADPASDQLLYANVFYPYEPPVSADLQNQLNADTAAAHRAHFPIKVALIASRFDLGAATSLFGQPQRYAAFLDNEISTGNGAQPLLVVMPDGYGVAGLSARATAAAATLQKPASGQSNDLARAAIVAVGKLAIASNRPLGSASQRPSGGGGVGLMKVLALAAVAVAGAAAVFLIRRTRAYHR
jgi:hypothetical protein